MKRIICIISLVAFVLGLYAQVSVESKIDSIEILIGEQTDVVLTVTAKEGAVIKMPVFKPSQYITPGVEVLSDSKADTSQLDNNIIKVTKRYTLTSFDENLYYIPPMKVTVDGKKYQSKSLALKVLTVPVDTLHPEKFFPPKDVQNNPFQWEDWASPFWFSVLFVLMGVLAYYLWTRLKENKPVIARVRIVKKVLPHQKALSEIEHIKSDRRLMSEDQKAYYTLLTDVLRKYIKERFGFNAMEMTSSEIITRLQNENDKKMVDELKELFVTADLVKFVVERIEPKLTETDKRNMRSRTILKVSIIALVVVSISLLALAIYQVSLLI